MSNDTPQDARIRALMVELAESSPLAPTAEELGLSNRPATIEENNALPSYTEVSSMVIKEPFKRRRLFGGLAAAATMLVGGSVAFNAANDDVPATPEKAVYELLDAMAEHDALGIIELIDPNERRALTPSIDDIVAELERVEVLESTDTEAVSGFDFAHENVVLSSRELGDGVWAVRLVEGSFSSSTDASTLPLGSGFGETDDVTDFGSSLDNWIATWPDLFAESDFELVVTEAMNGSGWHISAVYTFMEQARKEERWPEPDYSIPLAPTGATSPEAAAEQWLVAQGNWDVPAIINLLDPVEMPAMHRYAQQLADVVDDEMLNFSRLSALDIQELRVEGDGNERTVIIEQFQVTQRYETGLPGEEATVTTAFDGVCRSVESSGDDIPADAQSICRTDEGLDAPTIALIDAAAVELRVVERDGAWFVSPVGTVVDQALDGLRVRNADGFDEATVFLSLFEIPVLPFYSVGGASSMLAVGESFVMDDAFFECEPGEPSGLRTEQEAARAVVEYEDCLIASGFEPEPMTGVSSMIACSHIWTVEHSSSMSLEEAVAASDAYGPCVAAGDGPEDMGNIVAEVYCSESVYEAQVFEEQAPAENSADENAALDSAFAECFDAFGVEAPPIPPPLCQGVFASLDEGEILTEEEFNELAAEFPECFGE